MKSRNIVTITAALITTAAILLTAGLSLLHGAAFEQATDDEIPMDAEVLDTPTNDEVEDNADPEVPDNGVEPVPGIISPEAPANPPVVDEIEIPDTTPELMEYPNFEYNLADARDFHYCGCNQDCYGGDSCSHANLINGVVIDIYSHKTGKLVGQLAMDSEEMSNYISQLMEKVFDPWAEAFDPNTANDEERVNLPEGDYRVEVYAGTWVSYTYGQHGIYELTQCALTFYGGEIMTGYFDYLISDYIAEIEAGNVEAPDPEMAVSKLEFPGLEGYWDGYYNEALGRFIPGADRYTERFPYLED